MESPHPIVSVDRSVKYYFGSIDIDNDQLADFYNNLPFADKPPLEECRIHFSALAHVKARAKPEVLRGAQLFNPNDSVRLDVTAPPADIVILLGSFLLDKSETSEQSVNESLAHELIHYSQSKTLTDKKVISDEERLIRDKLIAHNPVVKFMSYLLTSGIAFGISIGFEEAIEPNQISIKPTLAVCMGVCAILNLIGHKKRQAEERSLRHTLFEQYVSQPEEIDARTHNDLTNTVKLNNFNDADLKVPLILHNRAIDKLTQHSHRLMSLGIASPE